MMYMKFMTSMKCMKLTLYVYPYISCKYHAIVCFFRYHIIMISSDNYMDGQQ